MATTAATGTTNTTSITTALGAGSGIDTKALVASLIEAQFSAKNAQLTARADKLTAQISGIAKLKSGLTGFDSALKALVKGGSLATQPTSSNTGAIGVSLATGGKVAAGTSASLMVEQLAQAQAATTNTAVAGTAGFRGGSLTVKIGSYSTDANGVRTLTPSRTVPITIAAGATIEQVAAQIKQETGLATQLIADGGGVRLTVKGTTGADQAFEITGSDSGADAAQLSLATLSVGPGATGTTMGTAAQNAVVTVDGARFSRSSNNISDLIEGVKLDLAATTTAPVTIGTSSPSSSLSQAVSDFVETYNQLHSILVDETNPVDGALKADSAASGIGRALGQLTLTRLATSTTGGPQTLADIGVATNRDGTLSVDNARLTKVLASDPKGVEALFADGTGASNGGLSAAFSSVVSRLTDKTYGLDAATSRYTKQQAEIGDAQTKASSAATAASERLTRQFATMDSRVAAYKATQTFLTNQIAAWNKSDS